MLMRTYKKRRRISYNGLQIEGSAGVYVERSKWRSSAFDGEPVGQRINLLVFTAC